MGRVNRYKDLQLSQLRSFALAATEGNFTVAARALGTSVPTVWQQVRALERKLGTTLLWRRGRNLELTQEGKLLLELIQPHVIGLDSLERLFETRCNELPQYLTVASTYYLLSYHLPRTIQKFTASHPSIRFNVRAGIWPEVMRLLERGDADLAVVSYLQDAPRSAILTYEHLFDLRFMLLTAKNHPLSRKKKLSARDLSGYPMILSAKETFSRKTLERVLAQSALTVDQLQVIMESPNTDLIRKYVSLDLGIALTYVGGEVDLPDLSLRVFDAKIDPLPVFLVSRKGAHMPEPVQQFQTFIRKYLQKG